MAGSILDQMLAAAATAAGGVWDSVKGDVTTFAENLIKDSAQASADFAAGKISSDDFKNQLIMLGDYADILANYTEEALKVAAQNAFNAAIDALWSAVTSKIP